MAEAGQKFVTFSSVAATATLAEWSDASGWISTRGDTLAEAALMALVSAEVMAMTAGARPSPVLGPESFQISDLGVARQNVSKMSDDVATVYLATHGAVRLLHRSARRPWRWEALGNWRPDQGGQVRGLGALPVGLLVVAGVGLAASIIGGWYYKTETKAQELKVDGDLARSAQITSTVAQLAQPYIVSGQPVPPALIEPLRDLARTEKAAPFLPWVGAAAVAGVALGGYLGSKHG